MINLKEAIAIVLSGKTNSDNLEPAVNILAAAMAFDDIRDEANKSGFVTKEDIENKFLIKSGMMIGLSETSKYIDKLKEQQNKPVGRKKREIKE